MRRRAKGEGSVYRRSSDGLYVGALRRKGHDPIVVYGSSRKAAADALHIAKVRNITNSRITLGDWLEKWLEDSAGEYAGGSLDFYRGTIDKHVTSSPVAAIRLNALTPDDVRRLLVGLEKRNVSALMRRRVHSVLKTAVAEAYRLEIVDRNVIDRIRPPKATTGKRRAISVEAALAFVAAALGDRNEALFLMLLVNGLRESEAFGLRPDDVDLKARTLRIERQLYERKGGIFEQPPKGGKTATIPLAPIVVDPLRRLIDARGPDDDYLFTSEKGRPLRRSGFYRYSWRPFFVRTGLPYFVPHQLRHTTATLLKRLGVPVEIAREILRHASIATTADIYQDEITELQQDALERLSVMLRSQSQSAQATSQATSAGTDLVKVP
jgi:integrase